MAITASIVGSTFITVMMDGKTLTVNQDHVNYSAIREALRLKDHDEVEKLINVKASLINFVKGQVRIEGEQVFYGDMEVGGPVVERILAMVRENFDSQPMLTFLGNLMENSSRRAVNELYGFLEESELPITEDGCFLAYKKVDQNYKDFYTGKFDNSVGSVVKMVRNQVDEDKDTTCSYGLHFCSLSYLPHYHGGQGKVMIVKINPKDVVSIPNDYNNAKGRCCEYVVVGEHTGSETEYAFTSPVYRDGEPVSPTNDDTFWNDDGDSGDDQESDYDNGYEYGCSVAKAHSEGKLSFDTTLIHSESFSDDYCNGYDAGYEDHYTIDWEQEGYNEGKADAEINSYFYNADKRPDLNSDNSQEFKTGYAEGWRDAKIDNV